MPSHRTRRAPLYSPGCNRPKPVFLPRRPTHIPLGGPYRLECSPFPVLAERESQWGQEHGCHRCPRRRGLRVGGIVLVLFVSSWFESFRVGIATASVPSDFTLSSSDRTLSCNWVALLYRFGIAAPGLTGAQIVEFIPSRFSETPASPI